MLVYSVTKSLCHIKKKSSLIDCKLFQVTSNRGKINDNALTNYV